MPTSTTREPSLLRATRLRCVHASSRGPIEALSDVSFSVAHGERLAVVGESGAGKSTLLRCLNLLVRPTQGAVHLGPDELTTLDTARLAQVRRTIGMVFQHFALLHRRTARQNVALPLELAGVAPTDVRRRVDELLARVRLRDEADAYPAELSGGQRQRVGIARALAHAPQLVLCDEPTSALDPESARMVTMLLDEVSTDLGLTIVLVTHQLELVRGLADRVAVLERGRLAELTSVAEFFARPRSEAGARLLAMESRMVIPPDIIEKARQTPGIGPSTILNVVVASSDDTAVVLRAFAERPELRLDVIGANIAPRRGAAAGSLSLVVHGAPDVIRSALDALRGSGITLEVVGHVDLAA